MNARLLPWAAMALIVLGLAVRFALPGKVVSVPGEVTEPETAGGGPEIRLGPVQMRELHDDGSWNRLEADGAVYAYASRTLLAGNVAVFLGDGAKFSGTTVLAPQATWDLDGMSIGLPEGCRLTREGGWSGQLSAAKLDLARSVMRGPGPARIEGPGISVEGKELAWRWDEGKITLESPISRIQPGTRPGRKG